MKRKCTFCGRIIEISGGLFVKHFSRRAGASTIFYECAGSGKEPPAKKGLFDGYKTYDPKKEGYGHAEEWREVFRRWFGKEEIEQIIGKDDPWSILGIKQGCALEEAKSAFRKKALELHPDKNHDRDTTKDFQRVQAAWQRIEETF